MNSDSSTASAPPTVALSDSQREALISLLADEDNTVYQTVRTKLMSYGPMASAWMKPFVLSNDPLLRRRAREIVNHFARQDADAEFLTFCLNQGEELDLELGVGLLSKTFYPEASLEALTAQLDEYSSELRIRLLTAVSPQQKLLTVNHFLFVEQNFRGNLQYESSAENCYFNRIMERRTGNPIGLCTLFLLVCRRLGLPVAGIGLPGHFVCRFQNATLELFIDCFNQGRFLTKADCIQHLHNTNHGLDDGYLAPVSSRRILMRTCANLQQTYLKLENIEEAGRIKRYLVALAN